MNSLKKLTCGNSHLASSSSSSMKGELVVCVQFTRKAVSENEFPIDTSIIIPFPVHAEKSDDHDNHPLAKVLKSLGPAAAVFPVLEDPHLEDVKI